MSLQDVPVLTDVGKPGLLTAILYKLSSGKRAPFLCGVEINRIRDLGDLGEIIHLCIGERGSSGDDQKRMLRFRAQKSGYTENLE